jgi:RHS repeat-associated protein
MKSDYYPFGMQMPGRSTNGDKYRYGYNGMEKDIELKGVGNSYTTEFRQYDPRLGRWLSLDPLKAKYPSMSPYVAFNNNPIYFTDPLGLEGGDHKERSHKDADRTSGSGPADPWSTPERKSGRLSNFMQKLGSVFEPPRTYTKVSQKQHDIWKSQQRVNPYYVGGNNSSIDKNEKGQYFLDNGRNKERLGTGNNLWNYGAPMMYQVEGEETVTSGGQTHQQVFLLEPLKMTKKIPTNDGSNKSEPIEMRNINTVKRKAPEIQDEINKKVKDLISQGYKPEDIEIKFFYTHNITQGNTPEDEFNLFLNKIYGESIGIFNQLTFNGLRNSGGKFIESGAKTGNTLFVSYEIIVTKSVEEYSYD